MRSSKFLLVAFMSNITKLSLISQQVSLFIHMQISSAESFWVKPFVEVGEQQSKIP